MFKSIAAAAMIASASAQFDLGLGGLGNLLLLDQFSGGDYYGYGHGNNDLLSLAAFGGFGGSADGNNFLGGSFTDYLLLDEFSSHSNGHYGGRGGFGGDFLPLAMLSGGFGGIGGAGGSDLSNIWALNEFGGGHHGDFEDMALLSAFGGIPADTNLNQLWGTQQVLSGNHDLIPFMQASGQALPTDLTSLWLLDEVSGSSHHGSSRRHGSSRHGSRRHGARRGHQGVRHAAPRHGYSRHAPRTMHSAPRTVAPMHSAPVAAVNTGY